MIRLRFILLALAILALALPFLFAQGQNTVTICHQAGTASAQTLQVSEAAVLAHMAHNDTLGACPLSPTN